MTKLRDPTSAPGAFGQSIYQLKADLEHGDAGVERAARIIGKAERTLYKYVDPEGSGPPIGVAEAVDEIHRGEDGIEINFEAWAARRARRIAGGDGEVRPDPSKLLELVTKYMDAATKALSAGRGDAQEVYRLTEPMVDGYAALTRAIMQRLDEEGATRNRRAEDHRPFRPTQAAGRPRLVRD